MAKDIARNDPCPCGSGKKYKNCCLNKAEAGITFSPKVIGIIVLGAIVGFFTAQQTDTETGIAIGMGVLIVAGMLANFMKPPPSSGKGDPGAINFGG